MEEAIQELTKAIQQINTGFDWASVISALCSVISLIAIWILLKERGEKKRPYLQVSFELLRGNLVCLVIRNVGEVPAKLNSISFNEDFIRQLPEQARKHAETRENINISIYPKQQWVLCLDIIVPEALEYQNTKLNITIDYFEKGKKRKHTYIENETVNFNDYSGFLVYISEMDELRKEIKNLGKNLETINYSLRKLSNINVIKSNIETYTNLSDHCARSVVTEYENTVLQKKGEGNFCD